MADRDPLRPTRDRIGALLDKWRTPLGFGDWIVRADVYKTSKRIPGGRPSKRQRAYGIDTFMLVKTRWHRQQVFIYVNAEQCSAMADDELERCLLHELAHALVNEMRERDIKHEERTVTTLANVLMWVREAGINEGKEARRNEVAAQ